MAQLRTIPLDRIFVPTRLRAVEEDQALAMSASIVEHGLINPITVRHTPRRSATPYTLVSGAHRLTINGGPAARIVAGDVGAAVK